MKMTIIGTEQITRCEATQAPVGPGCSG